MKRLRTLFGANTPRNDENPLEGTVYAIGDIHGHAKKLKGLLKAIIAHSKNQSGPFTIVFVGDYIDRGPEIKETIRCVRHDIPAGWKAVYLRGNHEHELLTFLKTPASNMQWFQWGGVETCQDYGVQVYDAHGLRSPETLAAELLKAVTSNGDLAWMEATQLYHQIGPYTFVHAGVRPGISLANQMSQDLLFIRDDFHNRPHGLATTIIYGHTILAEPLLADDRIGIDTGAYTGGPLTAVALSATQPPEFVQYT